MTSTGISSTTDQESSVSQTGVTQRRTRARSVRSLAHGRGGVIVARVLLIAAIFALWQLLTSTGVMDPFFFSKPSDIFARAWEWFRTGYILDDLATTLEETALGFVLGTLLGLVVGFVLARLQWFARVLDPIIKAFNALPRIVLAPIFLLWFGLGMTSKVALGVTVVFFIVFFNVFRGVQEVDQTCLDNVHMLGASEAQKFRHVYLPSALTWIFSSLHISIGFALTAATVSEYLGANRGVGYIIARSELTFDTTGVFAGMLILTVAVVLIDLIVNRAESYLLRWQPTRATDEAGQLT